MHTFRRCATVFLVILGLLYCSDAYAIGETGAQFLKIGMGSKACAMGQAFAAVADDPSAIYWNPAGLSQINSIEIMVVQDFWLLDMSYQYFAAVIPSNLGNMGIAFTYSSSGKIPKYENFRQIGEYDAYDAAGTVAYAKNIFGGISFGVAAKLIRQRIENEDAHGLAADVGLLYELGFIKGIKLGASVQNLGSGIKFVEEEDPLPLNVKGGIAYSVGFLTLACDVNKYRYNELRLNAGAELSIKYVLSLRGGYNSDESYSAGVGLTWRQVSVGYAFVPYEDIDESHQISAVLKF